jgi:hippurate hydrolase
VPAGRGIVKSSKPLRERIDALARSEYPLLEPLYLELHAHPELSGQEKATSARIAEELGRSGLTVYTGIGGHGVVGVLANGPGPTVMIRSDMDALPIPEKTGLPYASAVSVSVETRAVKVGVMHACGHDLHMTIMVGAVRLLAALKEDWSGTLLAVGQPAEETGAGARAMVRDGIFSRFPPPDFALALHVDPNIPAGKIGYRPGIISAGSTSLDVTVRGIGGHAAHPHQSIDPVVAAARIILALQTVVSREIDPREMAVLTVGAIHGGTKHNAIPDEVVLRVNIRYNSDQVRDRMLASIDRIVRGIAISAGVPDDLMPVIRRPGEATPPMENDPALTERVRAGLVSVLGEENVVLIPQLTGSEDFSVFGSGNPRVPICYMRLGAADPRELDESRRSGKELPYLHSSRFAPPPDPTIRIGSIAMAGAVAALLSPR